MSLQSFTEVSKKESAMAEKRTFVLFCLWFCTPKARSIVAESTAAENERSVPVGSYSPRRVMSLENERELLSLESLLSPLRLLSPF